MNFALLGDDPAVLPLVRAIAADRGHTLTDAALMDTIAADVVQIAPGVRLHSQWEDLLSAPLIEAVVVAGTDDEILNGAKQLAAAGKSLLVYPSAGQGSTFAYELQLIRDDSSVALFPVFPLLVHPQLRRLKESSRHAPRAVRDETERIPTPADGTRSMPATEADGTRSVPATLGDILYLQCERELHQVPAADGPLLLSVDEINDALLPDVALLRHLGGDYNQVTALNSGATAGGVSLATVALAGEHLPEASWSLKATSAESNWRLTVTGTLGRAVLSGGSDPSRLTLETQIASGSVESATEEFDPGPALLELFEQAENKSKTTHHSPLTSSPESGGPALRLSHPTWTAALTWTELVRVFETVEACGRSLRRRRTVDLHFETTSERSIFKTQMTALGCGLLVATFVGVLLYLAVGALLGVGGVQPNGAGPEEAEAARKAGRFLLLLLQILRVVIFLPLLLFLALQLLLFITRTSNAPRISK